MHLIDAQYKILDVFEKNTLQSLMLGSSAENPEDIVVINEIAWSPLFSKETAMSIFEGLINLKTHSEDESSCQLVTTYHKGLPIVKYLSSRALPFSNRINLCYAFLKDMVAYTDFNPWIQDILIDEDQIIVWEDQLLYNELLVLKTEDAAYQDSIAFSKVQKKIFKIMGNIIGSVQDASPALISFMDRLKNGAEELSSLQNIYQEFQKVYLYDYYLDQDDAAQETPKEDAILTTFIEPPDDALESELSASNPSTEGLSSEDSVDEDPSVGVAILYEPVDVENNPEYPVEKPSEIPDTDTEYHGEPPITPLPEKEPSVVLPILQELDAVDSDMEKNLELFFNRDKQLAETPAEEELTKKKKTWPMVIAAILLIALVLWASADLIFPNKNPVSGFSEKLDNNAWHLKNTSTFAKGDTLKRSEWMVYLDSSLIARYDTQDLTFPLEDEGTYQVTLRVMDSSGRWSLLFKKALDSSQKANADIPPPIADKPAEAASAGEELDQLNITYSAERTQKDTAFFRTGSYSLKISSGKTPELLDVHNLTLNNNGMVSFWIAGENTASVTMDFTGYSKDSKVFTKQITHNPVASKEWEMRQFTVESKTPVDRITILIKSNAAVYIDDLNIDSFK